VTDIVEATVIIFMINCCVQSCVCVVCVVVHRGPAVDVYGFERPADFDFKSYDEFMSHYVHVLARRAGRWATLLDGTDQLPVSQKCNYILSSCYL